MRKYLPTLSELVDRLSIVQLKEVFIPEHKNEYSKEIADITHDIQVLIDENDGKITAETIRAEVDLLEGQTPRDKVGNWALIAVLILLLLTRRAYR